MTEDTVPIEPESLCRGILGGLRDELDWKWDGRFETFLGEFGVDRKERIRVVVESYLGNVWDRSNIMKAPHNVQTLNNNLGGLLSGQMLFTSCPEGDGFVFCAWWPWSDGRTVSIRIGPSYRETFDAERSRQTKLLRDWIGI